MQDEISSELLATYAGLGTFNGTTYYRGEECLACVKDLIRALRDDDSHCEIRRHLGQAGVLKKDLICILLDSADNPSLRNDVIRLLVNLTQPAYLCFGSTYPQGKERGLMKCFMEVNHHLRLYKEAFTAESVMRVLGSILADLCQKEWEEREDEDVIVIERILLLIRNLVHVSPDPQEEKRTEDDMSIHDQIIWNLHINGIDELLVFLGSNESQWCMHVLEIFFLLLKEQSPSMLASTGREKTNLERKKDEDLIDEALAKEKERRLRAERLRGTRHSFFGGTFVVKNHKSISGRERVYHKPIAGLKEHSYDTEKRPQRVNKLRRPVTDLVKERVSIYIIRCALKNLCIQFLECCYNPLMKVVKENIVRRRAMENDETYYLWCLRFFMEFSRIHDFRVDIVGETLHLHTLHYIITLIANYYESMVVEKRSLSNARQWSQRLHYVVQAYKEILLYVQQMSMSHDETLQESAKVITSNLLYHPEYRDVFVTLIRNYYEVFQTKTYLRDLVEATHVYIKMMEKYCSDNKHTIVQERRKRGGGKGRGKKKGKKGSSNKVFTDDQLIDLWETIDARVAELMEGVEPLPPSHSPFDATSQLPMDDQKVAAMGMIRMFLIDAQHPEAVSLLRAAREVWPGAEFGDPGISVDDEMDVMKAILFNPAAALPVSHLLGDEGSDSEEEEGGGAQGGTTTSVELEFDLRHYLQRFCTNKLVRVYSLVLADYSTNQDSTNHAVVKMLYRIAVQLKMAPLLYQISVFRTFLAILSEPSAPRFKDLQKFSRHIVRGFFHMAKGNSLMFVELLFWKTSRDCYELEVGYGTLEKERKQAKMSLVWTREQEEELASLYQEYREEEDVVGCLEAALEGSEVKRSRKQIANQLVKQCLVMDRKELHRKQPRKVKGKWSEEELERLKEVFSEVEGSGDSKEVLNAVMSQFPHRGVHDVSQQLKEAGLVQTKDRAKRKKAISSSEDKKKYLSASIIDSDDEDSDSNSPDRQDIFHGLDEAGRQVTDCVRKLHASGHTEDLQWLEAYLTDEARDRTIDSEWEEMCVVAVNNRVAKALKTEDFQQLLLVLGLKQPSEEEPYWKIPSTMTPQELTTAAQALRPSAPLQPASLFSGNNTRVEDGDHVTSPVESHDSESCDHNEMETSELSHKEILELLLKSRGKQSTAPSLKPVPKRPRLALRNEFLESDSDSSPEVELEPSQMHSKGNTRRLKRRGKGRNLFDVNSSDEENDDDGGSSQSCHAQVEVEGLNSANEETRCQAEALHDEDDDSDLEPTLTIDLHHNQLDSDDDK